MASNQEAVFITGAAAEIGCATALTSARNGYTVGRSEGLFLFEVLKSRPCLEE
ncbi:MULTISPECIES: hypothetical protein [unclassified Mycolicibacterium]|uniref:hypothetical protein n=1 Tax=unclassified Mycolicibacterium TaxID=2636767 RepID=UPI001EEFF192|nr:MULTISPECIES: hypothetical protein [unclassified Mycolicibacterium]